jgi:hypothetical protein
VTICFDIKKGSLVIDLNHAILLYGTLLGIKKASLSLSLSLSLYTHSTWELAFKVIPTKPLQDQHNPLFVHFLVIF